MRRTESSAVQQTSRTKCLKQWVAGGHAQGEVMLKGHSNWWLRRLETRTVTRTGDGHGADGGEHS